MKDSEYSLNAKVTQYLHLFLPSQDSQRDNQVHFDAIWTERSYNRLCQIYKKGH